MRIRSVKPEFWQSLTLARASLGANLLFLGLFNYCDDEGLGIDSVHLIRGQLFALRLDVDVEQIEGWLQELASLRLIIRYDAEGRPLLAIRSWKEHQRVSHPKASRWPAPEGFSRASGDLAKPPEALALPLEHLRRDLDLSREQGAGSREGEQGAGNTTTSAPASPSEFDDEDANGRCSSELAEALGSTTAAFNLEAIARQDDRWLKLRPGHIRALNGGGPEPWRQSLVAEALSRIRLRPPATPVDDPAAYLTTVVGQVEEEAVAARGSGEEA